MQQRIYHQETGKMQILCSGDIPEGYSTVKPKKIPKQENLVVTTKEPIKDIEKDNSIAS
jgi:hypothetical protein